MAESLTVSAAISLLGEYNREFQEVVSLELQDRLFDPNNAASLNTHVKMHPMGNATEIPLTDMSSAEIVQPADATTFAATAGAIVVKPRLLKSYGLKVDLKFLPQELDAIYFASKKKNVGATTNVSDINDLAFGEYFMATILERIEADLKKLAVKGNLDLPSGMLSALDGIEEIIDDLITGSEITAVTPTSTHVVEQLEEIFDSLGTPYQDSADTVCVVAKDVWNAIVRADRQYLGRNWGYVGNEALKNALMIDGYNCPIVRNNHLSDGYTFITGKENFVLGMPTNSGAVEFKFQEFERYLKVLGDMRMGVQIRSARTTNRPIVQGTVTV
jgi:hypothetical protein